MDNLLIAILIAGLGLSGAYLRAELRLHRRLTALQRRRELVQREVHAKRVRLRHNKMPQPVPSIRANVSSVGEGFGARFTHLYTRPQYSPVFDSYMSVKRYDEHRVPWRAACTSWRVLLLNERSSIVALGRRKA
jgi:hypothetical protein